MKMTKHQDEKYQDDDNTPGEEGRVSQYDEQAALSPEGKNLNKMFMRKVIQGNLARGLL